MSKSAQMVQLENQLAEANLDVQSLREEVVSNQKLISNFTKVNELHQKELEETKNLLKATEMSVNRRVTEALAAIGVNQFASEEVISVANKDPQSLYRQFLALNGAEQTQFYKQHEKEISSFMNAK